MSINWNKAFNILWRVIGTEGENKERYYGGPKFIKMYQEVNLDFPNYNEYISELRRLNKSTSRIDWYKEIIGKLSEEKRTIFYRNFIQALEPYAQKEMGELRSVVFGDGKPVPHASISLNISYQESLENRLEIIDEAILSSDYGRAISLSYSFLEGFFRAILEKEGKLKDKNLPLQKSAKQVKDHIKQQLSEREEKLSEGILNSISTLSYFIGEARNDYSESHFSKEDTDKGLALYIRDIVHAIARFVNYFLTD